MKKRVIMLLQVSLVAFVVLMSSIANAKLTPFFEGWVNYPEPAHIMKAARANRNDVEDYLRWKRLTTANVSLSEQEILDFIRRNEGWRYWPSASAMQQNIEKSFSDNFPKNDIINFYGNNTTPITGNGWLYYLRAIENQAPQDFNTKIKEAWALSNFTEQQQASFLRNFGHALNQNDHIRRLDNLLYKGDSAQAARMYNVVPGDWKNIAKARLALRYNQKDADALVKNLSPTALKNEGVMYDRIRWRQKKGLKKEALDLAFDAGRPSDWSRSWWELQERASRDAYDMQRFKTAAHIAANHGSDDPKSGIFLEANWLAGRAAMKVSGMENTAINHFTTLYDRSVDPKWRSRGAYWAATIYKKLGKTEEANSWFNKGARFPHTYFGQLSAGEAGVSIQATMQAVRTSAIPEGKTVLALPTSGENRLANIAAMLAKSPKRKEARRFAMASCPSGSGANVIKICGQWARSIDLTDAALFLAKNLDDAGQYTMISELFPVTTLPSVQNNRGVERLEPALIHAIIRQESAFDLFAGSHAGAKGYMQLMPATAQETAKKYGMHWTGISQLFQKNYNITLGTHYLADQVSRYNGSYILAAAAYNAGPGRTNQWIKAFGDPRSSNVDAISWVENIPFTETRLYVQKVMENLLVYRSILDDKDADESLSEIMKNGGVPRRLR